MMNRRDFLHTGAAAGLALSAFGHHVAAAEKPLRVGLIGCGWYGKEDLRRLIQVAPVEVVALCDVDKRMLSEAAFFLGSNPFRTAAVHQGLKLPVSHVSLVDSRSVRVQYRTD